MNCCPSSMELVKETVGGATGVAKTYGAAKLLVADPTQAKDGVLVPAKGVKPGTGRSARFSRSQQDQVHSRFYALMGASDGEDSGDR
ncbi:hypothetical protein BBJ28_00015905 [Nothophytophthora sp. Chile5]|nr:hypothetical protein BBJ28_00015905 [Nothophytophthora sp. Chile5]